MNFLKKLGTIALKVVGIASGFMPLAQATASASGSQQATNVVDKMGQAFGAVVSVEQVFAAAFGPDAKKGSDKLKAATPFVAQIIQQIDLLAGKKPKNEALFQDATARMTAAMADILNSFGE